MNKILVPEDPDRRGPAALRKLPTTLPLVRCESWCASGDGHPAAVSVAEQQCVGVEQRIETILGGSTSDDEASVTFATLISRAQQMPGQQPTFLIAIQAGDEEVRVELGTAELAMFVEFANVLLRQTTPDSEQART